MLIVAVAAIVVVAVAAFMLLSPDEGNGNETISAIDYHGNGGLTSDETDVCTETGTTVIDNPFTYEGRVFTGWNSAVDGSGTSYLPGDTISSGSDVADLYAQWSYALDMMVPTHDLKVYLMDAAGSYQIVSNSNPIALPSGGAALLVVMGDEGIQWTQRENGSYDGTIGNITYRVVISLEGAEIADLGITSGVPTCTFSYDGPVEGYVTAYTITSTH